MFLETNPIPVKWAVARLGLIEDGIRLPLVPLSRTVPRSGVMEAHPVGAASGLPDGLRGL